MDLTTPPLRTPLKQEQTYLHNPSIETQQVPVSTTSKLLFTDNNKKKNNNNLSLITNGLNLSDEKDNLSSMINIGSVLPPFNTEPSPISRINLESNIKNITDRYPRNSPKNKNTTTTTTDSISLILEGFKPQLSEFIDFIGERVLTFIKESQSQTTATTIVNNFNHYSDLIQSQMKEFDHFINYLKSQEIRKSEILTNQQRKLDVLKSKIETHEEELRRCFGVTDIHLAISNLSHSVIEDESIFGQVTNNLKKSQSVYPEFPSRYEKPVNRMEDSIVPKNISNGRSSPFERHTFSSRSKAGIIADQSSPPKVKNRRETKAVYYNNRQSSDVIQNGPKRYIPTKKDEHILNPAIKQRRERKRHSPTQPTHTHTTPIKKAQPPHTLTKDNKSFLKEVASKSPVSGEIIQRQQNNIQNIETLPNNIQLNTLNLSKINDKLDAISTDLAKNRNEISIENPMKKQVKNLNNNDSAFAYSIDLRRSRSSLSSSTITRKSSNRLELSKKQESVVSQQTQVTNSDYSTQAPPVNKSDKNDQIKNAIIQLNKIAASSSLQLNIIKSELSHVAGTSGVELVPQSQKNITHIVHNGTVSCGTGQSHIGRTRTRSFGMNIIFGT